MNWLELKLPPAALVLIAAGGMWIVSRTLDFHFSIPGAAWLSAGIALAGAFTAVLGVTEFRRAGTTVDPRVPEQSASLVTSGVYRYSRNPMYAGFLLVLCGWGLYLGSAWALLFIPAFVVYMNRFQIAPEERYMHEKFEEPYRRYASRVRRWI